MTTILNMNSLTEEDRQMITASLRLAFYNDLFFLKNSITRKVNADSAPIDVLERISKLSETTGLCMHDIKSAYVITLCDSVRGIAGYEPIEAARKAISDVERTLLDEMNEMINAMIKPKSPNAISIW
jgi:hypothetical protein